MATDGEKPTAAQLESVAAGNSKKGVQDNADDTGPRAIRGPRWFTLCMSLYAFSFLCGLDTTVVADVQGPVAAAFGHVDQLVWVGAGYPLGSVAAILPFGALYGAFDAKWLYLAGCALFEAGSAVCGAAPAMDALIVGRVVAGAGGTATYLGVLHYLATLSTRRERGLYVALVGFCWGVGSVLGPVIGGVLAVSRATWRWAFYANLVVGAMVAPIYLLFLPSISPESVRLGDLVPSIAVRIAKLDFVGFALSCAAWVTFAMAVSMVGAAAWPWGDGRSIAVWVGFGLSLALYVVQQYCTLWTTPETRSFPGHLLRSRTQVLLFVASAASNSSLYVVVYYVPLFFQFVHEDSPLAAAIRLLPYIFVTFASNLFAGWLLPRVGVYMGIYLVAGTLLAVGGSLFVAFLKPQAAEATLYGLSSIIGVGTGLSLQLGYAVATLKAPGRDMGNAISFQNIAQLGAAVITLVVSGQIYQNVAVTKLSSVLGPLGYSGREIVGAVSGVQSDILINMEEGGLKDRVVAEITQAMRMSFSLIIVSGAVMVLAAAGMRRENLFKNRLRKHEPGRLCE